MEKPNPRIFPILENSLQSAPKIIENPAVALSGGKGLGIETPKSIVCPKPPQTALLP